MLQDSGASEGVGREKPATDRRPAIATSSTTIIAPAGLCPMYLRSNRP
jgi:hypothetical protein